MTRRVLPYDYTSDAMDRGERMNFHPMTGIELRVPAYYLFSEERRNHYYRPTLGAWSGLLGERIDLARIGENHDYRAGDKFPGHWKFDPYSGEALGPWRFDRYEGVYMDDE